MNIEKGKFIVIYGINNLGKTTQAKMIVDRLNKNNFKAEYIKYPIYELEPSGKILNNYLRESNIYNLTPREAQIIYSINRTQYEKKIKEKLNNGINIIAEDYTGTGLSWGIGAGVDELFLKQINSHLLKEDLAFLFYGKRFTEAVEKHHKHETDNNLTETVQYAHLKFGQEYNWHKINANQNINKIHDYLWDIIINFLNPHAHYNYNPNFIRTNKQNIFYQNVENKQIKNNKNILYFERTSALAKKPSRAHNTDAGIDLYSSEYYSLLPGEKRLIKTGIKMAIPKNYVGLIWDKSGIANNGIHTMGGVIDSEYRGEIKIILINLSEDIYNITAGQKIAQMLIQKIDFPKIIEKEINDITNRDENGFGSSGLF